MNLRYQFVIDKYFKFGFTVIYFIIPSIFVIILVRFFKRLPSYLFIRNMNFLSIINSI